MKVIWCGGLSYVDTQQGYPCPLFLLTPIDVVVDDFLCMFFLFSHLWQYRHVSLVCTYKEKMCVCIFVYTYIHQNVSNISKIDEWDRFYRRIQHDISRCMQRRREVTRMLVWSQSPMWMTCCFFPFTSTRPGILGVNHGCPPEEPLIIDRSYECWRQHTGATKTMQGILSHPHRHVPELPTWDLWIFLGLFLGL